MPLGYGGREYSCWNCIYAWFRDPPNYNFLQCRRNNPDRGVDSLENLNSQQPFVDTRQNINNRVLWCGEWKRWTGEDRQFVEPQQ